MTLALEESRSETAAAAQSQDQTCHARTSPTDVPERSLDKRALREPVAAAILVVSARRVLSGAIDAVRAAGHSWRAIGIATGIPYQTLHRNRRSRADRDARET